MVLIFQWLFNSCNIMSLNCCNFQLLKAAIRSLYRKVCTVVIRANFLNLDSFVMRFNTLIWLYSELVKLR